MKTATWFVIDDQQLLDCKTRIIIRISELMIIIGHHRPSPVINTTLLLVSKCHCILMNRWTENSTFLYFVHCSHSVLLLFIYLFCRTFSFRFLENSVDNGIHWWYFSFFFLDWSLSFFCFYLSLWRVSRFVYFTVFVLRTVELMSLFIQ